MLDNKLSYEDFEPHVGSDFTIGDLDGGPRDGGPRVLTLTEAKALKTRTDDPDVRMPFSLLFTAPGQDAIEQQIHRLRHEVMGEVEIFFVPIARVADGIQYEAVFN